MSGYITAQQCGYPIDAHWATWEDIGTCLSCGHLIIAGDAVVARSSGLIHATCAS